MKGYKSIKDQLKRQLVSKYELERHILKSVIYNDSLDPVLRSIALVKLDQLPKNSSAIRIKNRCILTGRSRSIYRQYGLSRIQLRELASYGLLPGIKKSSW